MYLHQYDFLKDGKTHHHIVDFHYHFYYYVHFAHQDFLATCAVCVRCQHVLLLHLDQLPWTHLAFWPFCLTLFTKNVKIILINSSIAIVHYLSALHRGHPPLSHVECAWPVALTVYQKRDLHDCSTTSPKIEPTTTGVVALFANPFSGLDWLID